MNDSPERGHYVAAGVGAYRSSPGGARMIELIESICDAAVAADRHRMAEVLRSRTLHQGDDLGDDVSNRMAMLVQSTFLELADQIETGMERKSGPGSIHNMEPLSPPDQ